mgnify:CR=1 FL=1
MTKETELMPCPFCGGDEITVDEKRLSPTMNKPVGSLISTEIRHFCHQSGLPQLVIQARGRDTEEAIAAWNTRADHIGNVNKMVPEGYALVPLEPTDEMSMAGQVQPIPEESFVGDFRSAGYAVDNIYKAMIAAAHGVEGLEKYASLNPEKFKETE